MTTTPNHPPLPPPVDLATVIVDNSNVAQNEEVTDEEVKWFLSRICYSSPDTFSGLGQRLELDYGSAEAAAMLAACSDARVPPQVLPVLLVPGVGSRWRQFVAWWKSSADKFGSIFQQNKDDGNDVDTTKADAPICVTPAAEAVFKQFASHLGRVRTYRALSLDDAGLERILQRDVIFPSGELRYSADDLAKVLKQHGVQNILVARLFIAYLKQLIGPADPSISLHDDWQTTTLIASGYSDYGGGSKPTKPVYLFEVSAPVVLSVGWRLSEVAHVTPQFLPQIKDHPNWFCFKAPSAPNGCWFDSSLTQTERYAFFGMPFLKKNLRRLFRFETAQNLAAAVAPFVALQEELRAKYPGGEGHPVFTK